MAINSKSSQMWGRFEHTLDDKGRVIVPLKFRETLGDEFVLTIGPGNHIRAYPMPTWSSMEDELASANVHDELNEDTIFLQRMFGNCEFVNPDQQNRLSIPRHLRDWAKLHEGEPTIIIGSGTRLEFWSRTEWDNLSKLFTSENAARASMSLKSGLIAAGAAEPGA